MQKRLWFIVIIMFILTCLIGAVLIFAPDSTGMNVLNNNYRLSCLKNSDDNCLVMPSVTGLTSDNVEVNFPEQFVAQYHLVVMPFDREQQVLAVTWLPLFQELASENDNLQYWSIAALPELNVGIRFLVLTGIRAAIPNADVRQQVTVLFLEQQDQFLATLAINDDEVIQAFIMDSDGIIYYRVIGEFTTERGDAFRDALANLLGDG